MLEGGDYSHFEAKEIAIPDYLTRHHPTLQGETGLDIGLFSDIDFSSTVLPGLEVVDVLTRAFRATRPTRWAGNLRSYDS